MAGASLFALIDKIAATLDDVALMTKVAAKKTAGVLGDDLALNAQQVSGVNADRELPVVWAVAKGSAKNKLILVPAALLISAFVPWLITPLLMLGGAYLCFEGVEKILHSYLHNETAEKKAELPENEEEKIKGAIRTDFILSAEIIVIALGTVQHTDITNQILVVTLIAAVMTIGVYGLVAGIVKLDDAGLYLLKVNSLDKTGLVNNILRALGTMLVNFAPKLMKSLTVIGTIAMFLVGGSILVHGIPPIHHVIEFASSYVEHWAYIGDISVAVVPLLIEAIVGVLAGTLVFIGTSLFQKVFSKN